jgi:hypothetical protein
LRNKEFIKMKKLLLTLLLVFSFSSQGWATLAVTQSEECHVDAANTACTTPLVTTQATGSLFVCVAAYYGAFSAVTDLKGNAYSTAVAEIQQSDDSNARLRQVYKENATGGANTRWTLTLTANGFPALGCLEITGAATSGALDQISSNAEPPILVTLRVKLPQLYKRTRLPLALDQPVAGLTLLSVADTPRMKT